MHGLIPLIVVAVAIATAVNLFLKRINIPPVIGYILTGAIIGPVFHIHVHGNEQLEHLAEFGIVFLMFTIGLEFSLGHLKSMKREVFLFGFLQVFVTAALIAAIAFSVFGINLQSAIVMGAGLALSSTAIVLKILNETGQIKAPFGRNAVGVLVFQDLAVIPILLLVTLFTSTDQSIGKLLADTGINAILALGILALIGKFLLPPLFKAVAKANSKEIYMGFILMTVIGSSYIAHHFGFSYSLGGFLAGMMIAETIYKYQVEADLIPFRDLLLGVFFVTVGLQIDPMVVVHNIVQIAALGVGIMLLKALVLFCILAFFNPKKVALKSAITLSQIGEFALVVFSLLLANDLLEPVLVQTFMVTVVLSMIGTPVLINNADKLLGLVFKGKVVEEALDQSSLIGGHVILIGYGAFGRVVSMHLDKVEINHVIVTNDTDAYVQAKEDGKTVVFGDASDRVLLDNLKIGKAIGTILAVPDMAELKQISAAITLLDPELKIISMVANEEEREELKGFNHELLLDGNNYTASLLVGNISKSRLLAEETSKLQFLSDYSLDDPEAAIEQVEKEQARLLDIMSRSFDGLRNEEDIMHIKAYHESFIVLSEIIGTAIEDIMSNAKLVPKAYERLNKLLDNQHQLISMNQSLEELGRGLKGLEKVEETRSLATMTVEGLDTLLLALKEVASEYSEDEMEFLDKMTAGEGQGLSRIRESYLSSEAALDSNTKALLLSSTNHIDRLRSLFGSVGGNYRQIAGLKDGNN